MVSKETVVAVASVSAHFVHALALTAVHTLAVVDVDLKTKTKIINLCETVNFVRGYVLKRYRLWLMTYQCQLE